MENLTNMKQVDSKIAFDKKMTLLISVLGSAIGAGCVVIGVIYATRLTPWTTYIL